MQLRLARSWTSVDNDDVPSPSDLLNLNTHTSPLPSVNTQQNIQTLQRIGIHDRQISLGMNCLFQQQ